MNLSWLYALSVLLVAFTLPIFSYLTLIYRELGRMTTGRVHEHLEIFEAEIEPKLKINRRSGGGNISILWHFLLVFLGVCTTSGGGGLFSGNVGYLLIVLDYIILTDVATSRLICPI